MENGWRSKAVNPSSLHYDATGAPQSRLFARFGDAWQSRSVWSTVALAPLSGVMSHEQL